MAKRIQLGEAQLKQIIKEAVQAAMQQPVQQQQNQQQVNLEGLTSQQLFQQLNLAKQQNNQQLFQQILEYIDSTGNYGYGQIQELAPFLEGNRGRNGLPSQWNFNLNQLQQMRTILENDLKMAAPYQDNIPQYVEMLIKWLSTAMKRIYSMGGLKGQVKNGLNGIQFDNTFFVPYLKNLGINYDY